MAHDRQSEQLDRILAVVTDAMGADVIGVYLYGSAVAGGLRPRSDLDLFVVSRRRTTPGEKRRLIDGIVPLSRRGTRPRSWRPIELTIVAQSDVRPWRYPPQVDFQYGEWLHAEFESGNIEPSPESHADVGVLITMVLLAGRPLLGPPASEVLDLVPREDLVRAMTDGMESLLADLETDTANVVLTLARIWTTVATGQVLAKDDAADWALSRLPDDHRAVLTRARAVYLGVEEDRWDDLAADVRPHAEYVVGLIEGLARSEPA